MTSKRSDAVPEYRIEILFAGSAPGNEMDRARILANQAVTDAVDALQRALEHAGMQTVATARSVRVTPNKTGPRPRLVQPAAAE